jgi:peptidoglycan/xylan/chitin deacetylase (PgdA/CDA1 family)
MTVLKTLNRKVISPLLMNLQADRLLRRMSSNSILNLMYHGVTINDSNYFSPRHVSKYQFEKHLNYFSKEFDIISLSDAFLYLKENYKPKRKTLTISFDDGYRNNLYCVLPLLEKYNLKATFFVSGICTEEMKIRTLWTDLISCLKYYHQRDIIEIGHEKFIDYKSGSSGETLGEYLSKCQINDLKHYLDSLVVKYQIEKKLNSIPGDFWELLNSNEILRLSQSRLVEIGSHCHSHYKMDIIDFSDAKQELILSKNSLQNITDKEINIVAYPFGNYNYAIKDTAEEFGYKYQLAVDYLYQDDLVDLRILNRHGIPATTTFQANILLLNNAFRMKGYN